MSEIDNIITERHNTHGDYKRTAVIIQDFRRALHRHSGRRLSDVQFDALENILTKIGRILSGNPKFAEHWQDIGGYARLGEDDC